MARYREHKPKYDIDTYMKPFPKFKKPKIIGHYSRDETGEVQLDESSKRFIRLDSLEFDSKLDQPIDLTFDVERFVPMPDETGNIILHLLHWIKDNRDTVYDEFNGRLDYDFVMSGGSLRLMLKTPYMGKTIQKFEIYKLNQTYFIFAKRKKTKRDPNGQVTEREMVLSSIGHKFEMKMTSPTYGGEVGENGIVYEAKRFQYVLNTIIGKHKILYTAKIDSVDQVKNADTDEVTSEEPVELCLAKGEVSDMKTWPFQRLRMLDYWCKAFLAGIEKTLIGFRNDDFVVEEMSILKTSSIPAMVKPTDSRIMWNPNVCANFVETFLNFIQETEIEDRKFYEVTRKAGDKFYIKLIEESDYTFPEWYCNEFA